MNSMSSLIVLFFVSFLGSCFGAIPSFGMQSATEIRESLKDSDFRIRVQKGGLLESENFTARIANFKKFPALAGQDVQSEIAAVVLKAGKPFFKHLHPRGAETLNVLEGVLRVELQKEGINPEIIKNVLKAGESTVFPQGLFHDAFCVSKSDCRFNVVFNTADPGLVVVV